MSNLVENDILKIKENRSIGTFPNFAIVKRRFSEKICIKLSVYILDKQLYTCYITTPAFTLAKLRWPWPRIKSWMNWESSLIMLPRHLHVPDHIDKEFCVAMPHHPEHIAHSVAALCCERQGGVVSKWPVAPLQSLPPPTQPVFHAVHLPYFRKSIEKLYIFLLLSMRSTTFVLWNFLYYWK